ncbi:TRAP transporter small permease [Azoarcus sp. L1K30]|uniref:TRAP transporter small permease subunit n=1 Tax=Azoarcus sp. L1K30 TaxID=2820277 RepID=UPI001B82B452|nr:TRAP transporter small permease [Azoarcus sp. L1K30]MBR0566830.1 TRAP transporter small permease [Azoarcus sp. L1K30]
MIERLENMLAAIFGGIFLALAGLVAVEVAARKLFGLSLQGANELGGYALAVGSTLAFTLALFGRNHIRVDVLHERLSARWQGVLNWLSAFLMASLAILLAMLAWGVVRDTLDYHSTAQTPWATPLIYPQGLWFAGQVVFMLTAVGIALRASWLVVRGQLAQLNIELHPRSVKEDLDEELDDLAARQGGGRS